MEPTFEKWLREHMRADMYRELMLDREYQKKMRDDIIAAHGRVIASLGESAREAIRLMLDEAERREYDPPVNNAALAHMEYIAATAG